MQLFLVLWFFVFPIELIASNGVGLVTAKALGMLSPKLRVVDAREPKAFRKGHFPGSQSLHWMDFVEERPGFWNWLFGHPERWGIVQTGPSVEARLRAIGLSAALPVAVIGDPAEPAAEGRTAWNLLYWGADTVFLVDGGYSAWAALPGSVPETGAARSVPPGDFAVSLKPARRATLDQVNQALRDPSRKILDVRTEGEFRGDRMKGQKRGGHLPRAELVLADALYEKDGTFLSAESLRKLVPTAPNPLTYCTGGVRSALLAVLLEAQLGMAAQNYDASLWEYSANPELPLVQ
jgi:thiosulfate/3-mercaptopyruvate sulfurtransferase